ncbi:MAG: cobalamin-independent methionine synthase II family protein [Verrucomicrobiaceae bacterium]|nr:cobalamin-independent methionine synthase II family protein [Verrucomicrobiaceae bacterium]
MKNQPLRTTVIGSYPFPGWLEFASNHLSEFGSEDIKELQDDAARVAIGDQLDAGLDVITDGEQTRLDFNLSFYGFLEGISLEPASPRRFGPPAHDQRGKHLIIEALRAPHGLGVVDEFLRLKRLAPKSGVTLKASVPGPYTLSGRLIPGADYRDRYDVTEALLPIVNKEIADLVAAGCQEICVDEPSMSCYGFKEDTARFVDIFNRTVASGRGRARICTHLCFGNFKGHPVGWRKYAPLFPAFLGLHCDEVHVEMANREYAELEILKPMSEVYDVAVGVVDVKSYYIESPENIADSVRQCLRHASADRLVFAPDCGLSQTARWAARQKLKNMVKGVQLVRAERGL